MSSKVKVLWVEVSERWGGPEQVAISDMAELARAKTSVSLLCIKGSPVHAAATRQGLDVHAVEKGARYLWDWGFVNVLRSVIGKTGANVVHINDDKMLWFLVPALRGFPTVSAIASRHSMASGGVRDLIKAPWMRRLDFMIVLSESVKHSVIRGLPLSGRKVKVVNLGLDFNKFNAEKVTGKEIRKEWGADKDTIVVGSVGPILPRSGHETFIKAAAGLLKYKDRKLRFVIMGEESLATSQQKHLEKLKKLVEVFGLEELVTFGTLGDNLPDIMAAFDIYVMPGSEEVPGLGALEALALKTPVVLSRVAGAEEVVGYERFGLLVRPQDAFDLQQKIMVLLDEPSTRLTMGENGRKYVLKHFEKRARFLKTVEIYEKCIKRRARRKLSLKWTKES